MLLAVCLLLIVFFTIFYTYWYSPYKLIELERFSFECGKVIGFAFALGFHAT